MWASSAGGYNAPMELKKLWARIEADLERARKILPDECEHDSFIRQYNEFLEHNELELACDMLEAYAENHPVKPDFWRALRDAAAKMQLSDRAKKYEWMTMPGQIKQP
jgi:hypothetical protein